MFVVNVDVVVVSATPVFVVSTLRFLLVVGIVASMTLDFTGGTVRLFRVPWPVVITLLCRTI